MNVYRLQISSMHLAPSDALSYYDQLTQQLRVGWELLKVLKEIC